MKWKLRFILILSTSLHLRLGAQTSEELTGLIKRVLAENYGVQLLKIDAEIAANNDAMGNAGMLPSVDLQAEQSLSLSSIRQELANGDLNRGDNARSTSRNAMVELNWTVFDGFKMFALRDQLGMLAELSELEVRYYIEQTVADVAAAYYALRKEKLLLNNLREALEVSGFRLALEEKKREIGSSNALNYNQARADFLADSALIVEQRMLIRQLEIQINGFSNDSLLQPVAVSTAALNYIAAPDREVLVEQALHNNIDYKRAMIEELIGDLNLKIQRSARMPEVDVFARYNYSQQANEVGFLRSNQNIGPSVGVAVRFNLYNGGNTNRAIENAGLSSEGATIAVKSTSRMVEGAVLQALNAYVAGMEQLSLAREREDAARVVFSVAQQQYEAGTINGFDFRLTQLHVLNAGNVVAELESRIKVAELELMRLRGDLLNALMVK